MYKVIVTREFEEDIKRFLNPKQNAELHRFLIDVKLAEGRIGKPLYYPFLKEKKIGERRVYFLVYDELRSILLVAISRKKDQQDTINHIKENLREYYAYVLRISS